MVVLYPTDSANAIAISEIELFGREANNCSDMPGRGPNDERIIVAAVNYKPTIERNIHIEHYQTVKKTDSKKLKHFWEVEA